MYKLSVILFTLILSACSTKPSLVLTDSQVSSYSEIKAPISSSLLVPCRVAYPLRDLSPESDLEGFYETLLYNLGEVEKCYNKDEELIQEVKKR